MPGLAAAIGAHPYLYLIAEKIARREFEASDAMALIRYADLDRDNTRGHPGVHVSITSPVRTRDFHLEGSYARRNFHSMFGSEQQAATAVALALNTQAGAEAVKRLQMLTLGPRVVLYSRSAAGSPGVIRSAGTAGVNWTNGRAAFVTLVLQHNGDGQLILITAYPNIAPTRGDRYEPPDGADVLEVGTGQLAVFWIPRA